MLFRALLLAIVGGLLLGLGYVIPLLWPLAFLAFVPMLIAFRQRGLPLHAVFGLGFLSGFVFNALSFFSAWYTLPLTWLGISSWPLQIALVMFVWCITSATFAVSVGVWAVLVRKYTFDSWWNVLFVASGWVIADWMGAWLFSIVNFGPHTWIGAYFSAGSAGYLMADNLVLLQSAWLGGLYALNLVLAAVGVMCYGAWFTPRRGKRRIFQVCLGLLIAGVALGPLLVPRDTHSSGSTIIVAAVSTQHPSALSITDDEADRYYAEQVNLISSARPADIVVLPEGSSFLKHARKQHVKLASLFSPDSSYNPLILDSTEVRGLGGTLVSRIEARDIAAQQSVFRFKALLMPFGERIPYIYTWGLEAFGQKDLLNTVDSARGLSNATFVEPVSFRGVSVGILMCSEAMSPDLSRDLVTQGGQVLVHQVSHSVYHGYYPMYVQARRIDAVRAVESRRWLIEAGNVTPSYIIDPYGREVRSTEWGTSGVVSSPVTPRVDTTPYTRFGQLVLLFPILVLVIGIWRSRA